MKPIPDNGDGVVILGAAGTLGQQLHEVFPNSLALDRAELDVTDYEAVRTKLSSTENLCAVLNCVAYNDVDGAETNQEFANKLNAEVPAKLAEICKDLDVIIVHYSTGFVFDGRQDSYNEDDAAAPLSVYADTKAKGEKVIINSGAHYYLIRTNVLFGPKGASEASKPAFVDIMMNVAKKTNLIQVVDDETYSITYAPDLARATKELMTGGTEAGHAEGIYHIVNSGYASWYGLATQLFEDLGFNISNETPAEGADTTPDGKNLTLLPVPGTEFPRPAKRPARVILNNTKLPALRPWQEALKEYLESNPQ